MRVWLWFFVVLLISGCQLVADPAFAPDEKAAISVSRGWGTYPQAENVSFSQVLALDYTEATTTISYGDDPLQFGKLWLPKDAHKPAPLVILVHGGCWLSAYDIKHSYPMATALMRAGFAVWSVEYRRTGDPGGGWPGSLNDVVKSINAIQSLTAYNIDWQNVSLTGHSAGGHLAMLAKQQISVPVRRTIGLAPIVDIVAYARGTNSCQRATTDFLAGTPEQRPARYAKANLLNTEFNKDVIILAGELDTIVPLSKNPLPAARFEQVDNAGHFDWVHPGTPAFAVFIELLKK